MTRANSAAGSVALLISAWLLGGCGGESKRKTVGEPGDASGQGGASAGGASAAGGTSSSGASGMSKAEACIAYTTAACKRSAECRGLDAGNCLQSTTDCPDVMFSAGSTRTIAGLLACAEAYATFSCAAVKYDQVPPCTTPGTLPAGAVCEFPSQCASLTCVGSPCGTCSHSVGLGQPCVTEGVVCADGLYCGLNGTCETAPDPNAPPEAFGERCVDDSYCPDQSFCQHTPASTLGTCVQDPDVGESCAESLACRSGRYCDPDQTCHELPGEGAPCGVDARTGNASYCSPGLVCNPGATLAEGTCGALPGDGAPCLTDATGSLLTTNCAPGLYCDTATSPNTCALPRSQGEACAPTAGWKACVSDEECRCADDACTGHVCVTIGFAGDDCASPNTACHPAFECSGGVCVPLDSQGDADACTQ